VIVEINSTSPEFALAWF